MGFGRLGREFGLLGRLPGGHTGPSISLSPAILVDTATVGTAVGTASIAGSTTGTPTWSLSNNASGKYAINSSTGAITVNGALSTGTDLITVHVTGTTPSVLDKSFTIFIVTAVPVIAFSASTMTDASTVGTTVGTATITGVTIGVAVWSLTSSASGKYAINSSTGVVTVASALTAGTDSITIRVTGTTQSPADHAFNISVVSANPTISFSPSSLLDTATVGAAVGTATISGTTLGTATWSLSNSAGGKYAIDSSSGAVTVAAALSVGTDSITIHVTGLTPTVPDKTSSITVTSGSTDFTTTYINMGQY